MVGDLLYAVCVTIVVIGFFWVGDRIQTALLNRKIRKYREDQGL